jgi:hypothetical protein
MYTIFNKFKSLAAGVMLLSFFMGVTLNSCTTKKKSENTENVEATSESEEHPEGEEHPSGEEHPAGEEHPSDSTKAEHPE